MGTAARKRGHKRSGLLHCNKLQPRLPPQSSLLPVQSDSSSDCCLLFESSMAGVRDKDPTSQSTALDQLSPVGPLVVAKDSK